MNKYLVVFFSIMGVVLGGSAGYFLRPYGQGKNPKSCVEEACVNVDKFTEESASENIGTEFVKLNNQFVIPVIQNGVVISLVVLSLSIEVARGGTERVFAMEPKLRASLLQVLFDHANGGGFQGDFTNSGKMEDLRRALLQITKKVLGESVRDVLISDIIRQDGSVAQIR